MSITDWDQRLLCTDGACVGVIGADGTCKVCGRAAANWGDDRRRGLKTTGELAVKPAAAADEEEAVAEDSDADADDDEYEDDDDEDADDEDGNDDGDEDADEDDDEPPDSEPGAVQAKLAAPADWNERRLCENGACIGVIGDDGVCKTCGAAAS